MRGCLASLHNQGLHVAAFSGSPGGYLKVLVPGAPVVIPLSSAAANPAGIPAPIHPYQRRRLLLYCAEYIRVAWSLVPIQDTELSQMGRYVSSIKIAISSGSACKRYLNQSGLNAILGKGRSLTGPDRHDYLKQTS